MCGGGMGRAWGKWPYNLGNIPGQVSVSFVQKSYLDLDGVALTCTCSLCGGLCCSWYVTPVAGADDCSCNGHGSKDGGSWKCWWSQYWCSAGWSIFFEYFLSTRPCSEQLYSFPCVGQKPRNRCSFSHTCHQTVGKFAQHCLESLSLAPLWLSPLLPPFTVLPPGRYSRGPQISSLSLTVHSHCTKVAFWTPPPASLHMDGKIQDLTTI